jgi:tRNA-specific 2-thiouridylase
MSGGVDSSVAAALLVEQGYDVVGVMLRLWAAELPADDACTPAPGASHFLTNRCCTPDAVEDARQVCATLGIPFYLVNAERPFRLYVVAPFVAAYAAGRTPNPCLACNRHIRFGFLRRYAQTLGAEYLATGHYARIRKTQSGYQLRKGADTSKDQSYVLYMLGQDDLAHTLFPVGEYTKHEVRDLARQFGLPVSEKPDSQDLCFVTAGSYRQMLRMEVPEAFHPGPILDQGGRQLGTHDGLPLYTVGQRRGLGLVTGEPLYVLELDEQANALVVGPVEALGSRHVTVEAVHYVAGTPPAEPIRVTAKLRYRALEAPALLEPAGEDRACLHFDEDQRAVAPGQGAVFYQGNVVIGGGLIAGRKQQS